MIAAEELNKLTVALLARGFKDVLLDHPWNSIQLEKDIPNGTIEVWMRDNTRPEELLHVTYSQGYEETIMIRHAETATIAEQACVLFESAMEAITTITP
jgi:hypothetical protein